MGLGLGIAPAGANELTRRAVPCRGSFDRRVRDDTIADTVAEFVRSLPCPNSIDPVPTFSYQGGLRLRQGFGSGIDRKLVLPSPRSGVGDLIVSVNESGSTFEAWRAGVRVDRTPERTNILPFLIGG